MGRKMSSKRIDTIMRPSKSSSSASVSLANSSQGLEISFTDWPHEGQKLA
jgi:hypothetical protein